MDGSVFSSVWIDVVGPGEALRIASWEIVLCVNVAFIGTLSWFWRSPVTITVSIRLFDACWSDVCAAAAWMNAGRLANAVHRRNLDFTAVPLDVIVRRCTCRTKDRKSVV